MRSLKIGIVVAAIVCYLLALFFVLRSEYTLVFQPKGIMARSQRVVIATNYIVMFLVVIPTFVALAWIALKYSTRNKKAKYEPEMKRGIFGDAILWIIPSLIIIPLIFFTWKVTHELDPYRPIKSDVKPLKIQVVALNWKWLFIYPEQGIATLSFVQFPAGTPIRFELAADDSPMNSFWIPQLSGQIYAMTGMITPLHMMADGPGIYTGRAAEINGEGYAGMTFVAQSVSPSDFEEWVAHVKQEPLKLTYAVYEELVKPSLENPVTLYASVEENLFNTIVMKYMHP